MLDKVRRELRVLIRVLPIAWSRPKFVFVYDEEAETPEEAEGKMESPPMSTTRAVKKAREPRPPTSIRALLCWRLAELEREGTWRSMSADRLAWALSVEGLPEDNIPEGYHLMVRRFRKLSQADRLKNAARVLKERGWTPPKTA